MEDRNIKYIENQFRDSEGDFSIKAKWTFSNKSKYVDVSNMFSNKEEMEELGLDKNSRLVMAFNKSGYQQLRDMGFSHKEIMKHYGEKQKGNKS